MTKAEILKEINLEYQFEQYLKRVGVTEAQLLPVQYQEMKRAFFGALGQMFVFYRDVIPELSDDDAVVCFQDIGKQIQTFWQNELKKDGH